MMANGEIRTTGRNETEATSPSNLLSDPKDSSGFHGDSLLISKLDRFILSG